MTATKPITADSPQGTILLALRAGDMEGQDLEERCGSNAGHVLAKLAKSGLVKAISVGRSNVWTLTPEGRDACPYRNPLAAPRADAEPTAAVIRSTNPRALAAILAPGAADADPAAAPEPAEPLPRLTAPRLSIDDAGALTVSQPGLGAFVLAPEAVARLGRFLGCFEAPEATP